MIYTAPGVMFLMQADTLRGKVGWVLEISRGPVKWHRAGARAVGECHLGLKKTRDFRDPTPSHSPK
jgi:hypothetical protein